MAIPSFHFDHPNLGLPRQPVPVRLACFAANWSIGMLATALSPEDSFHGSLLTAYEYNEGTGYVGEVVPTYYQQFRHIAFPTPETVGLLPANHFVWSDDLIQAYSNFVDLTWNRKEAHSNEAGVRWTPALGDCEQVVAQSADFSRLPTHQTGNAPPRNRIYCSNEIWTLEFDDSTVRIKDSKGVCYLGHLLTHPGDQISAVELYRLINPPPIQDTLHSSLKDAVDSIDPESKESSGFEGSQGGAFDPVIDETAKKDLKARCAALVDEIADNKERGNHETADQLEDRLDELLKYLRGSTNIGKRSRSFNRDAEKIRKAVRKALGEAIKALGGKNSDLGSYLNGRIKTGHDCQFNGDAWLGTP